MRHRILLPLLAVALCVAHNLCIWPWTLDDAFIYLRYAQNLADGHGPVFNPGERCEGYSSFLWVALLAAGNLLGADLLLLAKSYGALCVVGSIALCYHAWRFLPEIDRDGAAWASLFLGSCTAFAPWAMAGMETALLAFEVTFLVLCYARARRRAAGGFLWIGVLGALAAMTRPEGLLVFGLLALDTLCRALRRRRTGEAVAMAAGFLLLFAPFYAWRLWYYGYPLPNTFYAKVGDTLDQYLRGVQYSVEYLVPAALLLPPVLVAGISGAFRRRYPDLRGGPVLCLLFALYIVYVGGDFMPAFRFWAPLTPLLAIMAVLSWRLLPWHRLRRVAFVAVPLWGIAASEVSPKLDTFLRADEVARVGRAVGLWLRDNAPADAVIAVNAAGAIPYYSGLRTIDMLGLNDVHIAHRDVPGMGQGRAGHEKGDGAYVLGRRPDYVQFGTVIGSLEPFYLSDKEMFALPEFDRLYRWRIHAIDSGTTWQAFVMYELRERPGK